jgi:hypothetical protein
MELLKPHTSRPQRAGHFKTAIKIDLAMIIRIEQDLNKLNRLFSAASFMLAEHECRRLSFLCQQFEELKFKVMMQTQELRSCAIGLRKPISSLEMKLTGRLQLDISTLASQLDKFKSKLFSVQDCKREIL